LISGAKRAWLTRAAKDAELEGQQRFLHNFGASDFGERLREPAPFADKLPGLADQSLGELPDSDGHDAPRLTEELVPGAQPRNVCDASLSDLGG
jgi:hypothetical protein